MASQCHDIMVLPGLAMGSLMHMAEACKSNFRKARPARVARPQPSLRPASGLDGCEVQDTHREQQCNGS